MKFKGLNSTEQLELIIWDNMLRKYKDLYIRDNLTGEANKEFTAEVREFEKWYSDIWRKHFNGTDWVMDQSRVSTIVQDKMEKIFNKWEDTYGAGRLFLWKLMAPKIDPYSFTYFNRRISPAFKQHSLSKIKLGLRFINNVEPTKGIFTEFEKNMIYGQFATHYNNSFRAHYGQRGDYSMPETALLSNLSNSRTDIFRGSPLIDDIKGWEPSLQETDLNPQIGALFGWDNRSVAYNMAHMPIHPRAVGDLVNSSWWAYMPTAYIPSSGKIMDHPSINGWRNYQNAAQGDALAMLGHSSKLNLMYKKPIVNFHQPYENLQPLVGKKGTLELDDMILSKCK